MDSQTPILAVIPNDSARDFVNGLAASLGYSSAHIIIGTVKDAIAWLTSYNYTPTYLYIDAQEAGDGFVSDLRSLAHHCANDTQLVVSGTRNDIEFYRALLAEGVVDYFTHPVAIDALRQALTKNAALNQKKNSSVLSFISAAAGDGSSTVAMNSAFAMASEYNLPTILVDMDYQFGMVSKNLDLSAPFGIKEFFEHPDRGIDKTLVEQMVVPYKKNLYVIAAPHDLRFMPKIPPEIIRDLISALSDSYKCIVLDLPHQWSPWVSAAVAQSTHVTLVGQLWLKSVAHAARLLNVWRDIGISMDNVHAVINRSGAKFKEAVSSGDFEKVCNHTVEAYFANDIKTVVTAENQGCTVLELGASKLAKQMVQYTELLLPADGSGSARHFTDSGSAGGLLTFEE